jgi:hypothetical protein
MALENILSFIDAHKCQRSKDTVESETLESQTTSGSTLLHLVRHLKGESPPGHVWRELRIGCPNGLIVHEAQKRRDAVFCPSA